MNQPFTASLIIVSAACVFAAGCRSGERNGYLQIVPHEHPSLGDPVILAAEFKSTQPATAPATSQPATRPTTQPARPEKFTAPSSAIRALSLFGAAATSAAAGPVDKGGVAADEFSASVLADSLSGRAGLTAPRSVVIADRGGALSLLSREGLGAGPILALGLSRGPAFNIFRPQASPLSGPQGQCRALINAGFFNGDIAACERHFRH